MPPSEHTAERTTAGFFEELVSHYQPLLGRTSGTLRFDVMHGDDVEYWHLTISRGEIALTHESAEADAILRFDERLFDDVVCGRANAMAAAIRGELEIDGDAELLVTFQRMFPGPEKS